MRSSWWPATEGRRLLRLLRHPGDLLLFLRILLFAASVPILYRLKLPAVHSVLEPRETPPTPELDRVEEIVRYTEAALHFGWPVVRRSCLIRGTTLYYFLRRAGLNVALWFGVGYVDGALSGHCWLMKDGAPYLEGKDPRPVFTRTYWIRYDPAAESASEPAGAGTR